MKFLVPNYSCPQNPSIGGHRPQISVPSVRNWISWTPPPEQNSWVRHWWSGNLVCVLDYCTWKTDVNCRTRDCRCRGTWTPYHRTNVYSRCKHHWRSASLTWYWTFWYMRPHGRNEDKFQEINTMEQSPSWEANSSSASQELPHILWKPEVHFRVHKRSPPVPILSYTIPVHSSILFLEDPF